MSYLNKPKKSQKRPRKVAETYYINDNSSLDTLMLPQSEISPPPAKQCTLRQEGTAAALQYQISKLFAQQKQFSNLLEEVVNDKNQNDVTQFRDKVALNLQNIENQFQNHQRQMDGLRQDNEIQREAINKKLVDIQADILQIMQQVIQLQQGQKRCRIIAQRQNMQRLTDIKIIKRLLRKSRLYEFYLQCNYGANNVNQANLLGQPKKDRVNFASILTNAATARSTTDYGSVQYSEIINETIKQGQQNTSQLQQLQNTTEHSISTLQRQFEQKIAIFDVQINKQNQIIQKALENQQNMISENMAKYKQDISEQGFEIAKIKSTLEQRINELIQLQQKKNYEVQAEVQQNNNLIRQFGVDIGGLQQNIEDIRDKQQSLNSKINSNETYCNQLQSKINANYEEFQIFTHQQKIYQYFIKTDDLFEQTERLRTFTEDNTKKVDQFAKQIIIINEKLSNFNEKVLKYDTERDKLHTVIQSELKSIKNDVDNCQHSCNVQTVNDLIDNKMMLQQQALQSQQQMGESIKSEIEMLKTQLTAAKSEYQQFASQLGTHVGSLQSMKFTIPHPKRPGDPRVQPHEQTRSDGQESRHQDDDALRQPNKAKTASKLLNINKRLKVFKEGQQLVNDQVGELSKQIASAQMQQNAKLKKLRAENVEIMGGYLDQFNEILEDVQRIGLEVRERAENGENAQQATVLLQKQLSDLVDRVQKNQLDQEGKIGRLANDINRLTNQLNSCQLAVKQYITKQGDVDKYLSYYDDIQRRVNQHEELVRQQALTGSQMNKAYVQLLDDFGQYKQKLSQQTQNHDTLIQQVKALQLQIQELVGLINGQKLSSEAIQRDVGKLQRMNDLLQGKIDLCNTKVDTTYQQNLHLQSTQQLGQLKSTLAGAGVLLQ